MKQFFKFLSKSRITPCSSSHVENKFSNRIKSDSSRDFVFTNVKLLRRCFNWANCQFISKRKLKLSRNRYISVASRARAHSGISLFGLRHHTCVLFHLRPGTNNLENSIYRETHSNFASEEDGCFRELKKRILRFIYLLQIFERLEI